MKVTVIGGGNIGALMAAEIAQKGHEVTLFTSRPQLWKREISVFDAQENLILSGKLTNVTDDLQTAVAQAELIWITFPANMFESLAAQMQPYVSAGQSIGVVPGSGGAEFAFRPLIEKGCILFGLQRVHSIARLKQRGESVYMLGRKSQLEVGAIPSAGGGGLCRTIEAMFDIPCVALPNYLSVTLTPSNPILHTTRLYCMFRDYSEGVFYPRNFLFYEEWTQESSEMLIACDEELQTLCKKIPLDLDAVRSLRLHYESDTAEKMTKKISRIAAFRGLTSPMKEMGGGWVPDFSSRYFTADFSYGLKILIELCKSFGVPCDNMQMVWDWYVSREPLAAENSFRYTATTEEILDLYGKDY